MRLKTKKTFPMKTKTIQLEQLALTINHATKSPICPFSDGRWNVGSFFISQTDSGFELQRVANASGGTTDWLNTGHIPGSRLKALMNAFLLGINFKKDEKRKRESMTPEQIIEEKLREWTAQRGLTFVSCRLVGKEDVELTTAESPTHHLGYMGNGGYALCFPEFNPYLQGDCSFVLASVLPYYEAKRLAHELHYAWLNTRKTDV
jgi:hypothetical protein